MHTVVTTGTPGSAGVPRAMVLRLMPCSPWRRIRFVTIAGELNGDQTRLSRSRLRRLDTSNGCQDHTVLPYATRPRQVLRRIVHPRRSFCEAGEQRRSSCAPADRSRSPKDLALRSRSRPTLPRPPHLIPTFVTMANAPRSERDGGVVVLIWGNREAVYFCARDWTGSITLNGLKKLARFDWGLSSDLTASRPVCRSRCQPRGQPSRNFQQT